jgi:hypothetical protein
LIGAIVFLILGILFLITPSTFCPPIIRYPLIIRFIVLVAVLFFGTVSAYGLKKLFDKTIGLVIDDNGITDNTNAASIGLIEWGDITEIKTKKVMSTKFLLINTSKPDKYLERASGFKQKLMVGNMRMSGTPLSISSNSLKCNFNELEKLIRNRLSEQQGKIPRR